MGLVAFLYPEAIPEEIIITGADELGTRVDSIESDTLKVNEAIEVLLGCSLIRRTPEVKSLSIHRLVQAVLKDGMNKDTQRLWAERTIRAVNRAFPDVELQTWERCQRCLPHAYICATYIEEHGLAFPEAARLFNEAATYLVEYGRHPHAESLLPTTLPVPLQNLETNHSCHCLTLKCFGVIYLDQCTIPEAD